MKKFLIAFLMMAVVLVGVFATETVTGSGKSNGTATLQITTKVAEILPTFALKTTAGADAASQAVPDTLLPNPVQAATVDNALIGTGSHTVSFAVYQTNKSKTSALYQFTAAATDLVLVRKADGTAVHKVGDTVSEATEKFVCTTLAPSVAVGTTADKFAPGESANIIHYHGSSVDANTTVATFDVLWTKGQEQLAGDYAANVTLTVTAV